MGFRTGSYATIWSVDPVSDIQTKARISVSRKNKQSGEYETEFSGFVSFFGTAAAKKAACLKEKDRIKIGDCDVKTHYNKERNITYYNFNIFSFELQSDNAGGTANASVKDTVPDVDDGEIDDERLPF